MDRYKEIKEEIHQYALEEKNKFLKTVRKVNKIKTSHAKKRKKNKALFSFL